MRCLSAFPPGAFAKAMAASTLLHALVLAGFSLMGTKTVAVSAVPKPIEVSLGMMPRTEAVPEKPPARKSTPLRERTQPRFHPLSSSALSAPIIQAAPPAREEPSVAREIPAAQTQEPVRDSGRREEPPAQGGRNDSQPYVVDGPAPSYPPDARKSGREGTVRVKVLISEQGRAMETLLAQSAGTPGLDQAALAALRRWRFHPAYRDGLPVPAWVVVPVVFSLG
jgi:protein TonB